MNREDGRYQDHFVISLEKQIKESHEKFIETGDTLYLDTFYKLKEQRIDYFLKNGF